MPTFTQSNNNNNRHIRIRWRKIIRMIVWSADCFILRSLLLFYSFIPINLVPCSAFFFRFSFSFNLENIIHVQIQQINNYNITIGVNVPNWRKHAQMLNETTFFHFTKILTIVKYCMALNEICFVQMLQIAPFYRSCFTLSIFCAHVQSSYLFHHITFNFSTLIFNFKSFFFFSFNAFHSFSLQWAPFCYWCCCFSFLHFSLLEKLSLVDRETERRRKSQLYSFIAYEIGYVGCFFFFCCFGFRFVVMHEMKKKIKVNTKFEDKNKIRIMS